MKDNSKVFLVMAVLLYITYIYASNKVFNWRQQYTHTNFQIEFLQNYLKPISRELAHLSILGWLVVKINQNKKEVK